MARSTTAEGCRRMVPAFVAMAVVTVAGGGFSLVIKAALDAGASPVVFALYRDVFAALFLGVLAWVAERRKPAAERVGWPPKEHLFDFAILGLCGVWGSQLLSVIAVSYLPPLNFTLLMPTQPVIAFVIALAVGVERANFRELSGWLKAGGILVAVGGAAAVIIDSNRSADASSATPSPGPGNDTLPDAGDVLTASVLEGTAATAHGENPVLGNVYAMLVCTFGAIYQVKQKFVLGTYPSLITTTWAYIFGAGFILLSVLPAGIDPAEFAMPAVAWGCLSFAVLISSALVFFLMTYTNRLTSPIVVVAFFPLQPGFTALFQWIFQGKTITWLQAVGGLLIAAGLFAVLLMKARDQAALPAPPSEDGSRGGGVDSDLTASHGAPAASTRKADDGTTADVSAAPGSVNHDGLQIHDHDHDHDHDHRRPLLGVGFTAGGPAAGPVGVRARPLTYDTHSPAETSPASTASRQG